MTLTKRILSGASVLALAVGTAWAGGEKHASAGSQPEASIQSYGAPERLSFESLDVNGDGQLSPAEYESGKLAGTSSMMGDAVSFSELDKNGDGVVSLEELSQPELEDGSLGS